MKDLAVRKEIFFSNLKNKGKEENCLLEVFLKKKLAIVLREGNTCVNT